MGREGNHRCCFISSKPFVMAGVDSGLVNMYLCIIVKIIIIVLLVIVISKKNLGVRFQLISLFPFQLWQSRRHLLTSFSKVVVFTIIVFLVVVMMTTLVYVKYEWCHVLFKNNTVGPRSKNIYLNWKILTKTWQENPACTKNFLRDNIRLTSGEA